LLDDRTPWFIINESISAIAILQQNRDRPPPKTALLRRYRKGRPSPKTKAIALNTGFAKKGDRLYVAA